MKGLWIWLVLGLTLTIMGAGEYQPRSPLNITYVANTGFLIDCEGEKILIDALFGRFESDWCYVPSDSVVELMTLGRPPFDDVDLIAVTHAHVDHFDPEIVTSHLKNNISGILVCPQQVTKRLEPGEGYETIHERIHTISAPPGSVVELDIGGIDIKVISGKHGPYYEEDESTGEKIDRHRDVQHLEFIFNVGGRVLYHCGDAPMADVERYRSLGFGQENIDVAFVAWWDDREVITFRQKLVRDVIRPERVILTHLSPQRAPKRHPEWQKLVAKEVILPHRLMETWTIESPLPSNRSGN